MSTFEFLISAKFYTSDCYCHHLKTTLLPKDCLSSGAQIGTCLAKRKLLTIKGKINYFCPTEYYVNLTKTNLSGRRYLNWGNASIILSAGYFVNDSHRNVQLTRSNASHRPEVLGCVRKVAELGLGAGQSAAFLHSFCSGSCLRFMPCLCEIL